MATTEGAVIEALLAAPGVALLAATNVFLKGARQGAGDPYVTIERIVTGSAAHLDGPSNLDWPLMQIDCWSKDSLKALNLANAVRTAIDHVLVTSTTPSFYAVFQDQRGPAPDEETRTFRVSQDFNVYHERN